MYIIINHKFMNLISEGKSLSLIHISLQKVREVGGDNYSYANDYQIMARLKSFADAHGLCLLLVHHTRKQNADEMCIRDRGIILTGGPNSCYEPDSPTYTKELFELGIPVLGLCYGAQLMMHVLGGKVEKAPVREYGKTEVFVDTTSPLFGDVSEKTICWMSHFDYISKVAPGFSIAAHTACLLYTSHTRS